VRAGIRYLVLTAGRTRSPLAALAVSVFALLGTYAGTRNEVGQTFALTALLCGGLAAWLVGAVLDAEPRAQAEIADAALGGRRGRSRLDVLLASLAAGGLTFAFIAYPLALGAVRPEVFERHPRAGDLVAATLAHLSCGLLGGAVAVLFGPPRVARRATAIAAVLATLIALVALSDPLGDAGGPVAVARALADARPGAVGGALLGACASCLVACAAALGTAHAWARRSA
jgi:hypothetical protein